MMDTSVVFAGGGPPPAVASFRPRLLSATGAGKARHFAATAARGFLKFFVKLRDPDG
jgi:hypothetical protein